MDKSRGLFSTIVLGLGALGFAFFGVQWLLNPIGMAQPLGISLSNGDATSDARAVYGGLELGFGVFLAYSAWAPGRRSQGLMAATLAMAGLGLSRLIGIALVQGAVGEGTYQLLATDLGGTVLCAVALILSRRA